MTYPTEIKAKALALAVQGYTPFRIERTLGVDHHVVKQWIANAPEIPTEQRTLMIEKTVENVLQSDELLSRILEHLAAQPDKELLKHGLMLNAMSGTGKDKIVAFERAPQTTINVQQGIIVIHREANRPQIADTIDGADVDVASVETTEGFTAPRAQMQKAPVPEKAGYQLNPAEPHGHPAGSHGHGGQ